MREKKMRKRRMKMRSRERKFTISGQFQRR